MPKRCVSGLCNNTNEDGYSTHTWPKDAKVARKWDRFVKLDRADWKRGNPSDVLCGGHFRQPDDFISYGQWKHKFSTKLLLIKGAVPSYRKSIAMMSDDEDDVTVSKLDLGLHHVDLHAKTSTLSLSTESQAVPTLSLTTATGMTGGVSDTARTDTDHADDRLVSISINNQTTRDTATSETSPALCHTVRPTCRPTPTSKENTPCKNNQPSTHRHSSHSHGKRPRIDVDQTTSSRPTSTRADDHDDDLNTPITTKAQQLQSDTSNNSTPSVYGSKKRVRKRLRLSHAARKLDAARVSRPNSTIIIKITKIIKIIIII